MKVKENSIASVSCRAFGFPPPTVVWSKAFGASLPQGRTTVTNGTLSISNFSPQDDDTYQCKATNKLGSVSARTILRNVKPGKNQQFVSIIYYVSEVKYILVEQ